MVKILAFFLQKDITDYNESMGEMIGAGLFILFIVMLIGWSIKKFAKK